MQCNSMEQLILCCLSICLKMGPVVFRRCLFLFLQEEECLRLQPQMNFLSCRQLELGASHPKEKLRTGGVPKKHRDKGVLMRALEY